MPGKPGAESRVGRNKFDFLLNFEPQMPNTPLMRVRLLIGLCLAITGIVIGAFGLVYNRLELSVLASVCALAGCSLLAGVAMLSLTALRNRGDHQAHAWEPPQLDGNSDTSVIDPVTELPNEKYFEPAVESRVAAARRHLWPVSVVLFELDFSPEVADATQRNDALSAFSEVMRKTLREADIACRMHDTGFGLILEDTSEEGGVWTAERIQIALSQSNKGIDRLVAGVAAYPTHGLNARDVMVRARAALARAQATPAGHGLGQVEVAHVDLS